MNRPRRRAWVEARHALAGSEPIEAVPTAPLPEGVLPDAWDVCDCDYQPPQVDGKTVPHRLDPAWAWTEDKSPTGNVIGRALRPAVELLLWGDPRHGIPATYPLGGFHSGDPRFDSPGFPDLILWSPLHGRPIARELKRMGCWPEIVQAAHLTSMRRSGWDVAVWQPCCLLSGHISRQLSAWSGIPLHRADPYARLGPALPMSELASILAGNKPVKPRTKRLHGVPPEDGAGGVPAAAGDNPDGGGLPAGPATGYVLQLAGTVNQDQSTAIRRLRAWAVEHGVCRTDLLWPWRMIISGGQVFLEIRSASGKAGRRWAGVPQGLDGGDIITLVESLGPRTIAVATTKACMTLLAPGTALPEPADIRKEPAS